jgi:hypothetical protein
MNTVRVSADTRPPDWAVQRARAMHAALAAACDRATGQERARLAAELEQLARAIAEDRRLRHQDKRAAWAAARK